jgi:hypothetical protein
MLAKAGLALGSTIELVVHGGSVVLRKVGGNPREGWAKDAASAVYRAEDRDWLAADLDAPFI